MVGWFSRQARPFPWRTDPRDPYASLVSEFMLQQTQASRIADRFPTFMARFPSLLVLARAPLDDVLDAWSGLGYYRRARLLHAAVRSIAARHGGRVPSDPALLRELPGIGDYTAGAIAAMVFNLPAPAVDGNIARVLARLDALDAEHGSPRLLSHAKGRLRALLAHAPPAGLTEGLMEIGATVCTPRSPRCDACPLRRSCLARARGLGDAIPRPRPASARQVLHCQSILFTRGGRVLVERRPDRGLWAGLWQAPTLEGKRSTRPRLEAWIGHEGLEPLVRFDHATTHRDIRFRVWRATNIDARQAARLAEGPNRRWVRTPRGLALSAPQRRILALA